MMNKQAILPLVQGHQRRVALKCGRHRRSSFQNIGGRLEKYSFAADFKKIPAQGIKPGEVQKIGVNITPLVRVAGKVRTAGQKGRTPGWISNE